MLLRVDSAGRFLYADTLLSGFVTEHYANGVLKSRVGFYDGLKEGAAFWFYPSGDTAVVRKYRNGEKHGEHLGWYQNGQLKFQYFFENGLSTGRHKTWYVDGSPAKDQNYKAGREFGSQKVYRPDGKLRSNYVVRENGRKYGLVGLKRCAKLDSETGDFDPYKGIQ